MPGRVVFIEVKGGSDKGPDGHRKDTMPMVNALIKRGWEAKVVYYDKETRHETFRDIVSKADAYVSRVNPGSIPGGEATYMEMLRYMTHSGVIGMSDADTMVDLGAKDALAKLVGTGLALPDTYAYYTIDAFKEGFPVALSRNERVLKQNRGSTGAGIWHVSVVDEREFPVGEPLPMDTKIKAVEAKDNHVELHELGAFMTFCEQYITGTDGLLVDMRFLPRIKEGELRVLMVGAEPIFVVHKKPRQDDENAFSATLFSGATYTYDKPEKWPKLIEQFVGEIPVIEQRLGGHHVPLIWTADFILDDDENGGDRYLLGEINCSCVGFTSHLDLGIQDKIAEEIINVVTELHEGPLHA